MKCIKNQSGEIRRVENKEAFAKVGYGWEFVPKSEWKAVTRKPKSEQASEENPKKENKKTKKELV
jgi:hypothetical protein